MERKKRRKKILPLESQQRIPAAAKNIKFMFVTQRRVELRRLLMVTPKADSKVIGTMQKHESRLLQDTIVPIKKTEPKQVTGLVEHTKILERMFRGDFGNV